MVATMPAGSQPFTAILGDGGAQGDRVHRQLLVDVDGTDAVATDAQDHGRPFDRGVGLRRDVDAQRRRGPEASLGGIAGGLLAGAGKAGERADRGRVVEDAVELVGEAQACSQPIDRDGLQLRADR